METIGSVLVVDQSPVVLELLKTQFERNNYSVTTAGSVRNAEQLMAERSGLNQKELAASWFGAVIIGDVGFGDERDERDEISNSHNFNDSATALVDCAKALGKLDETRMVRLTANPDDVNLGIRSKDGTKPIKIVDKVRSFRYVLRALVNQE